MTGDEDLSAFARLVDAVHPWSAQLVVVGGWAHRLHRLLPGAGIPSHAPIATLDADLAFDTRAKLQGNIAEALATAGFREELATEHQPPVSWYRLGEESGFYAEFLMPLRGSGNRSDGSLDATESRGGVTAQKLRHLDLLITSPTTLTLTPHREIPVSVTRQLLVAHPTCFLAQKLLIAPQRIPAKRAQDLLYVHDTIELFSSSLDLLARHWVDHASRAVHRKHVATLSRAIEQQYERVSDTTRQAARIPRDRRLDPERMRLVCREGLRRIFSSS